jgi:glycosyltransferase involved in cell wall biosynthesis
MNKKVIVLGPERNTRGGISTVIKEYENTKLWKEFNCKWIGTYIDKSSIHKFFYFIKGFIAYILNISSYDIIHIHISWSTTAFRKMFFFPLAKALNKKVIIHLHSAAEPIINSKSQFPYKFMFKHADLTIFLSNGIRSELNNHFQVKKSVVLYNPCLKHITNSTRINEKEKQILFAGTITQKKGYLDLIQSFSHIAHKYPEWKLIFAGNGEIENAKKLATDLNIEEQLIFKGWVNREEIQVLFEKASIFCLPSYTEGFPMAVLDAWSYGLPVITTPVGGLTDVLIPDKNALVFEPGDIDRLEKLLDELITDVSLRKRISEESIKLSQEKFSITSISEQLRELYLSLS